MVLDENNATVRKYTRDTPPRVVREGSRRDPGAWPLAASQGYTWGLDLSRTVHGAVGIGGLLAAFETQGTSSTEDDQHYWFFYDAQPLTRRAPRGGVGRGATRGLRPPRRVKGNGNVGQVIKASDQSMAARYEYDPYGNVIGPDDDNGGEWQDDAGPYAAANPIRFSTKWFDTELAGPGVNGAVGTSGLGYWGYRYYSPRLGRWLRRDPIEELGGLNLYAFVFNTSVNTFDPNGHGVLDYLECVGDCIGDINDELWNAISAIAALGGCAASCEIKKPLGQLPGMKDEMSAITKLNSILLKLGLDTGKWGAKICKIVGKGGATGVGIAVGLLEAAVEGYCFTKCF